MSLPIRMYFREPTVDTNRPITEGSVPIEGFTLERVGSVREADAWDCGFAARMLGHGKQPACISIPAFPNRKFRLSSIFVNAAAGIEQPRDLAGKRVGIRFWANTAGIWARGALQHQYGLDLAAIQWVAAERDATALPNRIRIEYLNEIPHPEQACSVLDDLLAAGTIDALIDPDVPPSIRRRDPRTRRLFADYKTEEQRYFRQTGIYPISHVITLRQAFVDRHSDAPTALLAAFRRARDIAIENIQGSDPQVLVLAWVGQFMEEQRALMGEDYFAYDLTHNRVTLDAMMLYAQEQWLTSERVSHETLFDESALKLPGV